MNKAKVKMSQPIYSGLSILYINKTIICEFWCDYVKPKYKHNAKLCYVDTYNFIVYIKTVNIYIDIAYDVEKIFNTPNYIFDRSIGKNKKVIRLMEDKIGGKIITNLWNFDQKHILTQQMIVVVIKNLKEQKNV